jgi:hypothetical protein
MERAFQPSKQGQPLKTVRNFDDLMLKLAQEVDFKTGESLYGL